MECEKGWNLSRKDTVLFNVSHTANPCKVDEGFLELMLFSKKELNFLDHSVQAR